MSSPDGFAACFQGRLSDIGIGSKPATATATATPEAPATPAAPTQVATAPATPAIAPAETAKPVETATNPAVAATFGLLRAEPDGSTVIAGSGAPGSEVNVYSNGDLLGKTKVEASGDWVFVPEKPLPTGGVELTLGQGDSTDRAAQSFVVVIDPDKKAEPLVVASVPGKASEVLQGLAKPTALATTTVAAADTPAVTKAPESPATPTVAPVAEAAPAAPTTETTPATAPAAPAETTVATAEPNIATPATPASDTVATIPPSIDAIEIDGGRNFFAGGGAEGATVRLYVDDKFIADSVVSDGRWLVETDNVLTKPTQRIRVDMLKPNSAEVASRAEVNFVVELPKAEEPKTQVAANSPVPADKAPTEPAVTSVAGQAAPSTQTSVPEINTPTSTAPTAPTIAVPTVEAPTVASPTTPPPTAVATPSAPIVAPVTPTTTQQATSPTAPSAPIPPTAPTQIAQPVEQPAAPVAEDQVPTLVATQIGDAEDKRFASGKAIIRRGDNLWTIARRVYGQGIKYTTIYEANNAQIRNPNRIYPGQVFNLPNGQ